MLCSIFLEPLVRLLGANDDCIQYSMDYAQYVLIAAPFMITGFALNMCLKSEGSATFAMIGIGFGGVLNCFLDPLFIRGLGLGVKGASMATAISKFISCCILFWTYLKKRTATSIAPGSSALYGRISRRLSPLAPPLSSARLWRWYPAC